MWLADSKEKKIMKFIVFVFAILISLETKVLAFSDNDLENYDEVWQVKKTILIDPGHGGIDGGAVSKSGMQEKDINLLISLKVKELLQKEGYTVIMTRDIDKGLYTESGTIRKKKIEDLNNRLKMKIDSGCDMFLSIHLNYFPEPKYYGAQVWYGDNEESKKFASVLQQNLREYLDKDNKRMEKPAHNSYKILKNNGKMAAVIAECGFLTNINEEAKLKDDKYQQKIAEAMVNAINIYFGMN